MPLFQPRRRAARRAIAGLLLIERQHWLATAEVPDQRPPVAAGCDNPLAIAREGRPVDSVLVVSEGPHFLIFSGVPQFHTAVD